MTYDFATLAPDDFENLIGDLLSQSWGARLESFKAGKDKGIDLRNTRVVGATLNTIVQCKRFAPHKISELLRNTKSEKLKLDVLRPQRYVLVTSVPLSPSNKDALIEALSPWCRSTGDIYGASEVNGLLREHPEIERAHFKLWISSTAILERIVHSRIFNLTHATLEGTKEHLSKVVMHDGFNRALELLRQEHHVLIVGNPGIGKTTMARVIACHYMREQFEPVFIVSNIEDAWSLVHESLAANRRMVVLYDDFLGRFNFDSRRFDKNEEHSLLEFLNTVRRSPNLRLILTTREYILADAQRLHGAFDSQVNEILKCVLSLEDYSKVHRAKILFNHLYFSDLPDSRLDQLLRNKVYRTLIQHTHFNPRVVETVSKYANSRALTDQEYVRYVEQEFDNPSKLWEHPFRHDISPMAKKILASLWSFHGSAEIELLKSAVFKLYDHETNETLAMLFHDAMRQLDGNFILTNRFPGTYKAETNYVVVQFQNPSVEEFVDTFLLSEPVWVRSLIKGVVCFKQIHTLFSAVTGAHNVSNIDAAFWSALRRAAIYAESTPGGYLVNHRAYSGETRRVWDPGEVSWPRQTKLLLQIEARVAMPEGHSTNLLSRITSKDGWSCMLTGVSNDDSVAYGVSSLHAWIAEESGWSLDLKSTADDAFHEAVFQFVSDEEQVWCSSMSTLRILAERISLSQSPMTDRDIRAFEAAANMVIETMDNNSENYSDIKGEVEDLASLGLICGVKVLPQVTNLQKLGTRIAERDQRPDRSETEERDFVSTEKSEPFDIDDLFAGLLDR